MTESSYQLPSVRAVVKALASKEVTRDQILADLAARRQEVNPVVNAFDSVADRIETPKRGKLSGLPITVKDQIAVAGHPLRFGLDRVSDTPCKTTAPVIQRLVDEGAVVIGKTSLPPYAMDFQTFNARVGRTNNPWDTTLTCGGSSGGGAAAIASGMSLVDIGADLGGSLRLPAAYCGICSLLPGEGAVPTQGMLRGNARLAHFARPGPFARCVDDLRLVWEVISGRSGTSASEPASLAIWQPEGSMPRADASISARFFEVGKILGQPDFELKDVLLQSLFTPDVYQTYGQIMGYETGALMPWPIRMLTRLTGRGAVARSPKFLRHVHEGYRRNARTYQNALRRRDALIGSWEEKMYHVDAILLPVCGVPPFPHRVPESDRGGIRDYRAPFDVDGEQMGYLDALTAFTIPVTLLGLPVVTIPLGLDDQGRPIGAQLVGRQDGEFALLDIAERITRLFPMPSPEIRKA